MSEANLWRALRPALLAVGVHAVRIENMLDKGTPDVAYVARPFPRTCGWIELKHERAWPARAATRFRLSKLTLDQVLWHEEWRRNAWLLAQVGRDYALWEAIHARTLMDGDWDASKAVSAARVFSRGRLRADLLAQALSTGC